MATKVDFYIIAHMDILERLNFCCRLIEKAYDQKHCIYIDCPEEKIAHQLDELLWTFEKGSFLPHNIYGEGPIPPPPIQLGFKETPPHHRDIMINLRDIATNSFQQFQRVCEIITQDEHQRQLGRERFRFYRDQGCQIATYDLTKK